MIDSEQDANRRSEAVVQRNPNFRIDKNGNAGVGMGSARPDTVKPQ